MKARRRWDRMDTEVDVLIAGAGAAGMTAALVCALQGLDVLLCEKSSQVGGTTATSAGTIWVPGTKQAREAGFSDDIAEARRYLDSIIGPATDDRREAYLTTGPELVDYLARNSEVKFSLYAKHPDYLSNRPGTTLAGRALAPLPFDGRLLGADFALLRAPIGEFMALGGMMIGRDDIEPLARPFESVGEFSPRAVAVVAARHRPPAPPSRHAAADGQCARGAAVLQPAPAQGAGLAQRLGARTDHRGRPRHRRGACGRWRDPPRHRAARRRAGDRRIRRQRRAAQRICPPAAQARRRLRGRAGRGHDGRACGRRRRRGRSRAAGVLDAGVGRPDGSPAGAAPIRISRSTAPSPA